MSEIQKFNPEMLILAIELRRATFRDLAHHTKMHPGVVHKICYGILEPTEEQLAKFAKATNFPIGFFFREGKRRPSMPCDGSEYTLRGWQLVHNAEMKRMDKHYELCEKLGLDPRDG